MHVGTASSVPSSKHLQISDTMRRSVLGRQMEACRLGTHAFVAPWGVHHCGAQKRKHMHQIIHHIWLAEGSSQRISVFRSFSPQCAFDNQTVTLAANIRVFCQKRHTATTTWTRIILAAYYGHKETTTHAFKVIGGRTGLTMCSLQFKVPRAALTSWSPS